MLFRQNGNTFEKHFLFFKSEISGFIIAFFNAKTSKTPVAMQIETEVTAVFEI